MLIYGGSAYSYAADPDFTGVSSDVKFWQGVIDRYYTKYYGIKEWHDKLLDTVKRQGFIEIPSGRYYAFEPEFKHNDWKWPLTRIKNYPVQGFGADLVMLARIEAWRLLKESGVRFVMIQTIHDSIVVDTPEKNVYTVCNILKKAVESVPDLCRKHFGYDFSLALTCEVQIGMNKRNMTEYKFE